MMDYATSDWVCGAFEKITNIGVDALPIQYLYPLLYPRSFLFHSVLGDSWGTTESAQEKLNLIDLQKCRLSNIQKYFLHPFVLFLLSQEKMM